MSEANRKRFWVGLALSVVLWPCAGVQAQLVPPLLNYQGTLSDAAGQPLASGTYSLAFRVFASPCPNHPFGDSPVWGPQTISAQGVAGSFNVVLSNDLEGDSIVKAFDSTQRYIEIAVGAAPPILPRQQVLSAPFAMRASNGVPPGTVLPFAGPAGALPEGFLLCDGATLSAATYPALFAVIGTTYGGGVTFKAPDLRGRLPLGAGSGPSLTPRTLGTNQGAETFTMTVNEMPNHTHAAPFNPYAGGIFAPYPRPTGLGGDNGVSYATTTAAGGSSPFSIQDPSLSLNYIIKY